MTCFALSKDEWDTMEDAVMGVSPSRMNFTYSSMAAKTPVG